MREFSLRDSQVGIDEVFLDISTLVESCKFNDCRHQAEPGCAIKRALDLGQLNMGHYQNWLKIKKEQVF